MPDHHGRSGTSMGVKQSPQKNISTDHRTTVQGNKHFINTKITKGNLNTWYTKILDDVTGASVKNRAFFIKNYKRIKGTQSYLPSTEKFNLLSLEQKQDLYQKTRRNIMRGNLDPFGEKSLLENAGTQQDIERRRKEQATTQDTTQASSSTLLAGSPTDSELSQSDATNAAGTELTAKRIKKRGRKINVYTSSSGKTSDKLILGKKSLLGMV